MRIRNVAQPLCLFAATFTAMARASDSLVLLMPYNPFGAALNAVPQNPDALALLQLRFLPLVAPACSSTPGQPIVAQKFIWETPQKVRIQIQPNITFANSKQLNANDVLATITAFQTQPEWRTRAIANIAEAQKSGDNEITLKLKSPDPYFERNMDIPILPQEIATQPLSETTGIGFESGPYHSLKINDSGWVLAKNKNRSIEPARNAAPPYNIVSIKFISDPLLRMQMLEKGSADVAIDGFTQDKLLQISKYHSNKLSISSFPSWEEIGVGFISNSKNTIPVTIQNQILCPQSLQKIQRFSLAPYFDATTQFPNQYCDVVPPTNQTEKVDIDTTPNSLNILLAKGIAAHLNNKKIHAEVRVQDADKLEARIQKKEVSIFVKQKFIEHLSILSPPENRLNWVPLWQRNIIVVSKKGVHLPSASTRACSCPLFNILAPEKQ